MDHLAVGKKGEDIACKYLEQKGHRIVDRNFRVKFGEIDVVSEKAGLIYFSEVKTVNLSNREVGEHRPEDNVSPWKMKKLSRAIELYILKKLPDYKKEWYFLVIAVKLDVLCQTAKVKVISDVV